MEKNSLFFAIAFIAFLCVTGNDGLSCNCDFSDCNHVELQCPGGKTKDMCGCCDVCARQEGDSCGGLWDMKGNCDQGLMCQTSDEEKGMTPGVCVLDPQAVSAYDWNIWRDFLRYFGKR